MFGMPAVLRVFVAVAAADLRKGYDGLAQLARERINEDPLSGHLFVFANKKRDRIKILYWDRDGYAIWMKKQASDCTRPHPFTGNPGDTDNLIGRPLAAGGVG
jgi:transposase